MCLGVSLYILAVAASMCMCVNIVSIQPHVVGHCHKVVLVYRRSLANETCTNNTPIREKGYRVLSGDKGT